MESELGGDHAEGSAVERSGETKQLDCRLHVYMGITLYLVTKYCHIEKRVHQTKQCYNGDVFSPSTSCKTTKVLLAPILSKIMGKKLQNMYWKEMHQMKK